MERAGIDRHHHGRLGVHVLCMLCILDVAAPPLKVHSWTVT